MSSKYTDRQTGNNIDTSTIKQTNDVDINKSTALHCTASDMNEIHTQQNYHISHSHTDKQFATIILQLLL